MKTSRDALAAGCALMCCLLVCMGASGRMEQKTMSMPEILLLKDGYTLYHGMKDRNVYSWPLNENWVNTGYLVQPEGLLPPECAGVCLSAKETACGYLPLEEDVRLRADVLYALCDMQEDYPLQDGIRFYHGYCAGEAHKQWSGENIQQYQQTAATACGCTVLSGNKSEHELGLAVDVLLTGKKNGRERDPLKANATGRWMAENMWRYGFVYDAGNESCDAVHLRYVGKAHARMMYLLDMKTEEYLAFLQQQKTVTLMRGATMIACIQCVTDDTEFVEVPQGMHREISRDNRGNIILYLTAEEM